MDYQLIINQSCGMRDLRILPINIDEEQLKLQVHLAVYDVDTGKLSEQQGAEEIHNIRRLNEKLDPLELATITDASRLDQALIHEELAYTRTMWFRLTKPLREKRDRVIENLMAQYASEAMRT